MGYGTRGTGRTYDSNTGHGSMFGHRTKKLIGFTSKMRKCFKCGKGHNKKSHNCQGVHNGTAKSMESAAAVDLMSDKNSALTKANVKISVFIGDGDDSGICQVRAHCDHPVDKWFDPNHAVKSLNNFLFKLKPKHKFDNSVIEYLKRCFSYAMGQNENDPVATAAAIRNCIKHAFGDHRYCAEWCGFKENPKTYQHHGLPGGKDLTGQELFDDLSEIFERFANHSDSLSFRGTSQSNESFNNTVCSKAPKNRFYGGTASHRWRVAAAAAQTNDGTQYLTQCYRKAGLSPGSYTERLRKRKDYWKERRARFQKTIEYKRNRLIKKKEKKLKRLAQGKKEGLSYMSDVAFLQTSYATNQPEINFKNVNFNKCVIVYIDLETTGLKKTDEIIQVAAKCAKSEVSFSKFAYPLKRIPRNVTDMTGLKMNGGQLYLKNKPVPASTLRSVIDDFLEFLKSLNKPIILVGHNSLKFDFPRIYRLLRDFNLLQDFADVVCGLVDTLAAFRSDKEFSKQESSLKQDELAKKYIPNWDEQNAHEALWDCLTLEKLCDTLKYSHQIPSLATSLKSFIKAQFKNEVGDSLEPELQPLKDIISSRIVRKIAENGLSMTILKNAYMHGKKKSIEVLLAENDGDGRVKVTKKKDIIEKLTNYLKRLVNCSEDRVAE